MKKVISKEWYWAAVIVCAMLLTQYWIKLLLIMGSGNAVAYQNYWGADVGTYLLLSVLVVATPVFFYVVWKYYPRHS